MNSPPAGIPKNTITAAHVMTKMTFERSLSNLQSFGRKWLIMKRQDTIKQKAKFIGPIPAQSAIRLVFNFKAHIAFKNDFAVSSDPARNGIHANVTKSPMVNIEAIRANLLSLPTGLGLSHFFNKPQVRNTA